MNSKTSHIGDIAEMKLMLAATERGWIVSKPYGEQRYDLIVDTGKRMKRVQIKAASRSQNVTYYEKKKYTYKSYAVSLGEGYSFSEIDVLAIYLIDEDKWIFIPSFGLPDSKGVTRFSTKKSTAWYAKYVQWWEIF